MTQPRFMLPWLGGPPLKETPLPSQIAPGQRGVKKDAAPFFRKGNARIRLVQFSMLPYEFDPKHCLLDGQSFSVFVCLLISAAHWFWSDLF